MLIKWGSMVVGGRGKLGGQVYSKNRGGNYVRNNAVPSNPRSVHQMESRARLAQLSSNWSGLTQEQINGWNAAVQDFKRKNVFGDALILSGKNLFTSLNKELLLTGQTQINEAPVPTGLTVPTSIDTISIIDDGTLTFNVNNTATGEKIVLVATAPVSAGTSYVKNRTRVITTMDATTGSTSADIGADYVARFGAIQEGQKIFVGAYTVNAIGERSPLVKGFALATAAI